MSLNSRTLRNRRREIIRSPQKQMILRGRRNSVKRPTRRQQVSATAEHRTNRRANTQRRRSYRSFGSDRITESGTLRSAAPARSSVRPSCGPKHRGVGVLRALEKDPYDRYASGADLSAALDAAVAQWTVRDSPLSGPVRRPSMVLPQHKIRDQLQDAPTPLLWSYRPPARPRRAKRTPWPRRHADRRRTPASSAHNASAYDLYSPHDDRIHRGGYWAGKKGGITLAVDTVATHVTIGYPTVPPQSNQDTSLIV
jgi:hypothetical protein